MGKLTLSSSDTVYLKDDNDAKSAGKSCSMHVVCVHKSCTHAHKASYGICMCVRISSSAVCVCSAHMYAYKSYTHVRKISSAVCVYGVCVCMRRQQWLACLVEKARVLCGNLQCACLNVGLPLQL